MTNEQILKRAIRKAIKNGYSPGFIENFEAGMGYRPWFIFSHDFAKAFWGTEKKKIWVKPRIYNTVVHQAPIHRKGFWVMRGKGTGWKRHLQQMALYENPLKYLEQFVK
jgi:hypothetical protein